MLKAGIPEAAVKHKMAQEGLDPAEFFDAKVLLRFFPLCYHIFTVSYHHGRLLGERVA